MNWVALEILTTYVGKGNTRKLEEPKSLLPRNFESSKTSQCRMSQMKTNSTSKATQFLSFILKFDTHLVAITHSCIFYLTN